MKIVRESLPWITCGFCTVYRDCPSNDRFKEGERYCPAVKNTVKPKTSACKDFTLHKDFYCQNNNCWMTNEMCLNRIKKRDGVRYSECDRCLQGDMLFTYISKKGE